MKCNSMILTTACLLGVLVIPPEVQARGRGVSCVFHWPDNPSLNIKGGKREIIENTRKKSYDKLLEAGIVKAHLTMQMGGARCKFSHPDSTSISTYFYSDYHGFRLNRKDRAPACSEINMTVTCQSAIDEP